MRPKTACLALSLLFAALLIGSPVGATQNPANCSKNGVSIDITKSATTINNGDTVTYTVDAANDVAPSCVAINNTIKGFCPDAAGNPTVLAVTFPTIPSLAVPTAPFQVGTFDCLINVSAAVIAPQAKATMDGSLQDNPVQDDPYSLGKTVSVVVNQPQPPGPPNQIPTLSGWVMIMLAVFLALVGAATVLRKKPAA